MLAMTDGLDRLFSNDNRAAAAGARCRHRGGGPHAAAEAAVHAPRDGVGGVAGEGSKARGFAPGPHQGALPLGSPPRAEPLGPFTGEVGREGGPAPAWVAARPTIVGRAATSRCRSPSRPTSPTDGLQRRCLCWGVQGAKPPGGFQGRALALLPPPVTAPAAASGLTAALQLSFRRTHGGGNLDGAQDHRRRQPNERRRHRTRTGAAQLRAGHHPSRHPRIQRRAAGRRIHGRLRRTLDERQLLQDRVEAEARAASLRRLRPLRHRGRPPRGRADLQQRRRQRHRGRGACDAADAGGVAPR